MARAHRTAGAVTASPLWQAYHSGSRVRPGGGAALDPPWFLPLARLRATIPQSVTLPRNRPLLLQCRLLPRLFPRGSPSPGRKQAAFATHKGRQKRLVCVEPPRLDGVPLRRGSLFLPAPFPRGKECAGPVRRACGPPLPFRQRLPRGLAAAPSCPCFPIIAAAVKGRAGRRCRP